MAMPWSVTIFIMGVVMVALGGWVSSCIMIADEIAHAMRNGDISPFPIG